MISLAFVYIGGLALSIFYLLVKLFILILEKETSKKNTPCKAICFIATNLIILSMCLWIYSWSYDMSLFIETFLVSFFIINTIVLIIMAIYN